MSTKHTPWRAANHAGDWRASHEGFGRSAYQGIFAGDEVVAIAVAHSVSGEVEPERVSALIVRAVNAHDELLAALRNLREACLAADANEELSSMVDGSLLDAAGAAIDRAEGRS